MADSGGDLFAGLSMASSGGSPPRSPAKPAMHQTSSHTKGPDATGLAAAPSGSITSSPQQPQIPLAEPSQRVVSDSAASPSLPAPSPVPVVRSAPVTDKLLGLLSPVEGSASSTSAAEPPSSSPTCGSSIGATESAPKSPVAGQKFTPAKPPVTPTTKKQQQQRSQGESTANGSANKGPGAVEIPESLRHLVTDDDIMTAFNVEAELSNQRAQSINADGTTSTSADIANRDTAIPTVPPTVPAASRGPGVVDVNTSVPNCDVALRLFRKFARKTRPQVPESYGGTQRLSIMRFIFGSSVEQERKFLPYKQLMELILDHNGNLEEEKENEESTVEHSGDIMDNARKAVAIFCNLMSVWGHASAHMAEVERDSSSHRNFSDMLAAALDTATALVTHGCLDGVRIGIGPNNDEYHKAVEMLAQSVFSSDLSMERNELAAMKFLLSTGCRVTTVDGEAMLRGTHLLQTIRVLYHVYLTTGTDANKTTARASLQQLVTSVFIRMITTTIEDGNEKEGVDDQGIKAGPNNQSFPSANHRDAFLVLRSLCKLSMRSPPTDPKMHSHVGLQSSGSNVVWDSKDAAKSSSERGGDDSHPISASVVEAPLSHKELAHIYTQAIHPALESKILALDLLLYVLQNTEMKGSFLYQCGPQFHYAIRNYLCVSLLKNCTSDDTRVVNLSLMVFVPIIRNFRSILKSEIEAFVTNVFFVILDSKNSSIEHKILVVTLFEEICSDPTTLAEIFLNYDCDLSAVDLFHRIVNTLSKVSRTTEVDDGKTSSISLVAGAGAARMQKSRSDHRELRLEAMKALRHVLASLHARIVEPMEPKDTKTRAHAVEKIEGSKLPFEDDKTVNGDGKAGSSNAKESQQTLVQIYDSKKRRREEESSVVLRFNQKPSAGIAYAAKCGHVDGSDATDVARWLLKNKDNLEKTQIGEYLGREPEYQNGFSLKVLHEYVNLMDFVGLLFDDAIRFYLSGFRLPGEAQKIDRIMEKFAERYTSQNPEVFPTADVAFILAFSIIMLNTDLHNPAIKEERRMTKDGFIRNNRGICDGQDLPPEFLKAIYDRIKMNPISLKEDDDARERVGDPQATPVGPTSLPSALSPAVFFTSHYEEIDRTKETNFLKERDQIVRTTESLLKRRRHTGSTEHGGKAHRRRQSSHGTIRHAVRYVRTEDSGLRDEYVSPMFEVTWGPALAAFSTAMESANGTVGALLAIASDEELELAAENAAETIEVCLTGFRFAICTAGLCGNSTARDAFMLALARFSQLGTGFLLEPRHVRCIQTMLDLARSDGELLGSSWEHVFKSLSEINRFHQLFHLLARNDRVIAMAAERRKSRLQERERRHRERQERRVAKENSDTLDDSSVTSFTSTGEASFDDSGLFSEDDDDFLFDDEMDKKATDEANARTVYEAVSEGLIEAIYERSSSLSTNAVKEFVLQLCRVSRMEISHYGGHVGSDANTVDLTQVHYRQHHTLLSNSPDLEGFHHQQVNIYNLQKLVEVTHYNMDSRPRLVFADLWTTVAAHLTSTALHTNPAVAMYAVDSFRQLCTQYLQREELEAFEFQKRFLKPLETVMSRSELSTTKELLLKCVDRIILMFGTNDGSKGGMLRSGWRPILNVLGLAGRDLDEGIAKQGFGMLTGQLDQCLAVDKSESEEEKPRAGVLLAERFVDLVDALLTYVGGPHVEMSLVSLDHLVTLSAFLADESFALPLIKKRATSATAYADGDTGDPSETKNNQELELWWPILLGISRSVGDSRKSVRLRSLETLLKVINSHFFPSEESPEPQNGTGQSYLQTLQLIFRGILTPVLEFGEVEYQDGRPPELPEDFERFMTSPKETSLDDSDTITSTWLDTTFSQFMDGCIGICLRAIKVFDDDTLVEEVFAMLNSCLLSDSGGLAVRGLRCLEQFLSSDLKLSEITDDTWATVSHMLRRSLELRGLPRSESMRSLNGSSSSVQGTKDESADEEESGPADDEQETIREFVMEENMLANRRFVGSNAIMVIGSLLGSERLGRAIVLRWRLFLVSGVAHAMRDWEKAASILASHGGKTKPRGQNPPHYLESVLYGRKWMNRFLLQLAALEEVAQPAAEGSRQASAQALIKDQTQKLVSAYLEKEESLSKSGLRGSVDNHLFTRLTTLVKEMLAGYGALPEDHLRQMAWLNPVLSSCINTQNESIRIAIQKLVKRLHAD